MKLIIKWLKPPQTEHWDLLWQFKNGKDELLISGGLKKGKDLEFDLKDIIKYVKEDTVSKINIKYGYKPNEGGREMKVFFQGTFDGINAGHVRAIREVSERFCFSPTDMNGIVQTGRLVMGLNSDSLVNWMIGHGDKSQSHLILPFAQRKEILLGIKGVDEVIECHEPSALNYLKQLDATVYVLTEEWTKSQKDAIAYIESLKEKPGWPYSDAEVYFSPRYEDIYCNSDIRRRIIEGTA